MLFESALLKISSSSGEVDVEGLDRRLYRLEQQPQNMSTDTQKLFIVDKTNAQSIWRGVKIQLEEKNNPLLVGVWRDVTVSLNGNEFVVSCTRGAHALLTCNFGKGQINYKRELESAITKEYGSSPVEHAALQIFKFLPNFLINLGKTSLSKTAHCSGFL